MSVLWLPGHVPAIPKLSDEEFAKRLAMFKPMMFVPHPVSGQPVPWYMEEVNPHNIAFTWDPKPSKQINQWKEVTRIETYHTCGYIACFKPTIGEVLSQIPEHLITFGRDGKFGDRIDGFITLTGDTVACYNQGDGHRAVTIFISDCSDENWDDPSL